MSTAVVAAAPAPPPSGPVDRQMSPRQFAPIAPVSSGQEPAAKRARSNDSVESAPAPPPSNGKSSPTSSRSNPPPAVKVKKEPGTPALASSRPRPKRLDLSSSMSSNRGPQTARPAPLTARDSGLAIHDVGLACLSPGFQTNDPSMREQLQRSLDVRDQQRQIIEARQKGHKSGGGHDSEGPRTQDTTLFGVPTSTGTPMTSRRKGPPPGLSINAPAASQFANDRVIQSAPLHQTFTGLRPGEYPNSRHAQHGPSSLSQTSHIHNVPWAQSGNRLPPIADVFAHDRLEAHRGPANHSPHGTNGAAPLPSPGFPPPQFHASAHRREFRSSEEALQGMSGGREDMLPKVVHYGGVQPPTPPSPMTHAQQARASMHSQSQHGPYAHESTEQPTSGPRDGRPELGRTQSMGGRRRGREEYERDQCSPPSAPGYYPPHHLRNSEHKRPNTLAFRADDRDRGAEEDWRAQLGSAEKKEEFMRLMERAWDLFHS